MKPCIIRRKPIKVKKGVNDLFKSNPELSKIGSPELYSQYINTIFPNSQVKDIVYHGTDAKFDKFDTKIKGIKPDDEFGIFTSSNIESAKTYGKNLLPVIINAKNPAKVYTTEDVTGKVGFDKGTFEYLKEVGIPNKNYDSAISNKTFDLKGIPKDLQNLEYEDYIKAQDKYKGFINIVFKPEQTHILGSKKDIQGFKDYAKNNSIKETQVSLPNINSLFKQIKRAQKVINDDRSSSIHSQTDIFGNPIKEGVDEKFSNFKANETKFQQTKDSLVNLSKDSNAISTINKLAASLSPTDYTLQKQIEVEFLKQFAENLLVNYNFDKDVVDGIMQFLNAENYDLAEALIEGANVKETVEVSAPNGKPSKAFEALNNKLGDEESALRAYANMYTPEFQAWFKGSKVVDANGEPKILYIDLKNENGSVIILGENFVSNVPMVVSSTNPNINEDGNYVVEDINEVQDVFHDPSEEMEDDFSPAEESSVSTLALSNTEMLLQQKQQLYYNILERLGKINSNIQKIEEIFSVRNFDKKSKEYKQIKDKYKRLLNFKLVSEKLLNDYKKDIADLKNSKEEDVIKELLNNDLIRLETLMSKPNLTKTEYVEAKSITMFLLALKPVKNKLHPFFEDSDLFKGGEIILESSLLEYFNDLHIKASEFNNKLVNQRNNLAVNIVNANVRVKNLYSDKLTHEEILKSEEGLADTNWFDKMLMDASMGVFSDNGIIPQVALSEIIISNEQRSIESEKINKKIDELQPLVEKELRSLGQGINFLLIPGVSYDMFKQRDQYGLQTGKLITRYSTSFSENMQNAEDLFEIRMSMARYELDPAKRSKESNLAANKRQNWYRENTIQLDIRKIPEIFKNDAFAEFEEFFDREGSEEHVKLLKQNISEKAYKEVVEKQKKKLLGYLQKRKVLLETQSVKEFLDWDRKNNPFIANEYFYENIKINHETDTPSMEYNINVPRKKKAIIKKGKDGKLEFQDSNTDLEYYDANFEKIENNDVLYEFYNEILTVLKNTIKGFPPKLQEKLDLNTVMSIDKTITEAVLDSSSKFDAFSKFTSRIWDGFGKAISGKLVESIDENINFEKINDSFISDNFKEVKRLEKVSTLMLEKALGIRITKFTKIHSNNTKIEAQKNKIKTYIANIKKSLQTATDKKQIANLKQNLKKYNGELKKLMTYDDLALNQDAIKVLSDLLGVNETIDAVKEKLKSQTVLLKPLLAKAAANEIARQKSFDLPRILKLFSTLSAKYQARHDTKIIQDILKEAYQQIRVPKGSSKSKDLKQIQQESALSDLRIAANEQYDSWFKRVILDINGTNIKEVQKEMQIPEKTKIKRFLQLLKGIGSGQAFRILDKHEKEIRDKIDNLLAANEIQTNKTGKGFLDEKQIEYLKDEKENLGRRWGIPSLFSGLLAYTRLKSLGFSIRSAITNRMEGVISNNIISALGYITYENHMRAVRIAGKSFFKNITFGKVASPEAVKVTNLMSKLNKIQDSANELQKSSVKSSYSKLGTYLNPYELNKRVEFLNQSTLIVGSLLDTKIKDKNGKESNVFDALNPDGTLKSQFKTGPDGKKNIENWELFKGDDYKNWSSKTESMINLAHGNYSELRGMMAKDTLRGKAALMFKTWLPMAVASRFATEQENIILGKKNFKGRYRSYTATSTFINSSLLGFATFGTATGGIGLALGAGLGTGISMFLMRQMYFNRQKKVEGNIKNISNNVATDMGALQEAMFVIRTLLLKGLGMPVNRFLGGLTKKGVIISENAMGNYLNKLGDNFTQEDAENMNANMTEAAMLAQRLFILATIAKLVMSFWETEEEKDRNGYHNYVINQIQNLNLNIKSLTPSIENVSSNSDIGALPVVRAGKEIVDFTSALSNKYLGIGASKIFNNPELENGLFFYNQIQNGKNRGQYELENAAVKLLPGTIRDIGQFILGDKPAAFKETFVGNPFDMVFSRQYFKNKREVKALRLKLETQLILKGVPKSEAQKMINKSIPIPKDIYKKSKEIMRMQKELKNKE